MNKRELRAFSMGILLSVGILGSNYFFFEKKAEQPMDGQEAKNLLQKEGYTVITADDYKKLKQEAAQKNIASAKQEKAVADPKQNENKLISYQLQVTSGMSSGEIAKTLADHHIIENAKEFAQYLIAHKYQTKIQLGTYTLTNAMDYVKLAKIITKTQ